MKRERERERGERERERERERGRFPRPVDYMVFVEPEMMFDHRQL